jgi:hypothetical protein
VNWFGWLCLDRRHHWERVVGPCSSMAECSRLLGAAARKRGILDRHCCMTTGSYPRDAQEGIATAAADTETARGETRITA